MSHKKSRQIIDNFIGADEYFGYMTYDESRPWILFIEGFYTPDQLQALADLAKRIYEARDRD